MSKRNPLKQLSENLQTIKDSENVPLGTLLNDSFIQNKTPFLNLNDLFEKAGFKVETKEDFEAVPDNAINAFIAENSEYKTFQEMLSAAGIEYMKSRIFKGIK